MQQMLNTKELTVDPTRTSAFRPVTPVTKSPKGQIRGLDKKRDSGYGSDFSPASVKSVQKRFTFGDDPELDAEFLDDFNEMDIHGIDDEDVFTETFEFGFSAIQELEEGDDTDKEDEDLLTESPHHHSVSDPIDINRPPAPLPTPESVGDGEDDEGLDYNIGSSYYHTQWNRSKRERRSKAFRPFVSRSIGTQTPSPHCQLIQDAMLSSPGRIADPERHVGRGEILQLLIYYITLGAKRNESKTDILLSIGWPKTKRLHYKH